MYDSPLDDSGDEDGEYWKERSHAWREKAYGYYITLNDSKRAKDFDQSNVPSAYREDSKENDELLTQAKKRDDDMKSRYESIERKNTELSQKIQEIEMLGKKNMEILAQTKKQLTSKEKVLKSLSDKNKRLAEEFEIASLYVKLTHDRGMECFQDPIRMQLEKKAKRMEKALKNREHLRCQSLNKKTKNKCPCDERDYTKLPEALSELVVLMYDIGIMDHLQRQK
eukprot:UN32203